MSPFPAIFGAAMGICILVFSYLTSRILRSCKVMNQLLVKDITHHRAGYISPTAMMLLRLVYLLYSIAAQIYLFYDQGAYMLKFFTVWNYLLQMSYFALAIVVRLTSRRAGDQAGTLCKLVFVIGEVNVSMVILVAIVLWGLLYPTGDSHSKHELQGFYSISAHAMNVGAVGLEFLFNRMCVVRSHIVVMLLWMALYGLFAVIYELAGGYRPYFFLDIYAASTIIWFAGIMVFGIACYFGGLFISRFKDRVLLHSADRNGSIVQQANDSSNNNSIISAV
jgi:hypothetical protein